MIVVGTKLGGKERGGNSLNVAANVKTSFIAPYTAPMLFSCQSQRCWT